MRLRWSRTSERSIRLPLEKIGSQEPIFTIIYSGGLIGISDAHVIKTSVTEWMSNQYDSSVPTIEIVEMPWSRLKDQCVWMGAGSASFTHLQLCSLESLIAMVKGHGCRVIRTSRQSVAAVDFEWRASYHGWPLYYV
jgi:hypothetical protein